MAAGSSPQDAVVEGEAKAEPDIAAKTTDEKATPAESSPADKGETKGDMLSAVKAALEPQEKAPDSDEQGSKDEPKTEAAKEGEAEGDGSDDLTEEELARLRPKTRTRINNLLKERAERDEKIAALEPKAGQYDQIVGFVEKAGLTKDEVNQGFDVMNDLKNDPHKAYDRLRPIMDQLEQIVGVRLPEDLLRGVQLGQITEAHARELASARSRSTVTQQQLERRDQRDTERQQQEAHTGRVNETATAVTEWETSKSKSDPDWKLKQPRISEIIELEIGRRRQQDPKYFPTKAEALKFASDALTRVENDFKQLAPRRKEIRPGHVDSAATQSTAKPKTALEAARLALAATG